MNLIADKMPKKDVEEVAEEKPSSSANNNLDKKHDSGAADLEKVCSINPKVSMVSLLSIFIDILLFYYNKVNNPQF